MNNEKFELPNDLVDSIFLFLIPMQTNCLTDWLELEVNMMKLITKTICSI